MRSALTAAQWIEFRAKQRWWNHYGPVLTTFLCCITGFAGMTIIIHSTLSRPAMWVLCGLGLAGLIAVLGRQYYLARAIRLPLLHPEP